MVLSDRSLKVMMKKLVGHEDPSLLNPASIDIRVGNTIMLEIPGYTGRHGRDITGNSKDNPVIVAPKSSVLVATQEIITIPNGYVGCIFLKSSRAREGYNHALAGWIDPGWSGVITLEIISELQYNYLPLYPGLRIAQLVVIQCDQTSDKPYEGKYKDAKEVRPSYGA